MKTHLFFRSEESRFRFPSLPNSKVSQSVFDSKMFTQKRKTACDTAHRKNDVDPSVSALFFSGGPIAIVLAVSKFIVSAFYAQAFWRLSHICQKGREVFPFRRNFNASTTMIIVLGFIGIGAALTHIFPSQISTSHFAADRSPMTSWFSTSRSAQTASTTGQPYAGQQVAFVFSDCGSAIAQANVITGSRFGFQDFKFAQCGANQRRSFLWHNSAFPLLCFRGGSRYCSRDSLLSKYETGGAIYQG